MLPIRLRRPISGVMVLRSKVTLADLGLLELLHLDPHEDLRLAHLEGHVVQELVQKKMTNLPDSANGPANVKLKIKMVVKAIHNQCRRNGEAELYVLNEWYRN